jgi:hypothetical protein
MRRIEGGAIGVGRRLLQADRGKTAQPLGGASGPPYAPLLTRRVTMRRIEGGAIGVGRRLLQAVRGGNRCNHSAERVDHLTRPC